MFYQIGYVRAVIFLRSTFPGTCVCRTSGHVSFWHKLLEKPWESQRKQKSLSTTTEIDERNGLNQRNFQQSSGISLLPHYYLFSSF